MRITHPRVIGRRDGRSSRDTNNKAVHRLKWSRRTGDNLSARAHTQDPQKQHTEGSAIRGINRVAQVSGPGYMEVNIRGVAQAPGPSRRMEGNNNRGRNRHTGNNNSEEE